MSDTSVVVVPSGKAELIDTVARLRGAIYSGARAKHTPYLVARKEVVLPLVNTLESLVSSLPEERIGMCAKCPLWKHNDDMRVAMNTVDRLMRGSKEVTKDEAENLHNILAETLHK